MDGLTCDDKETKSFGSSGCVGIHGLKYLELFKMCSECFHIGILSSPVTSCSDEETEWFFIISLFLAMNVSKA